MLKTDPDPQWTELPGGPTAYTDEGEGPAVVCVHGYPGGPRDFRYLAPRIQGCRVLRLSLPGQGLTPLATEPGAAVEPRARFIQDFLKAMDLSEVILVGHSMGGGLVSAAVNERVRAVALLASLGLRAHKGFRGIPGWLPTLASSPLWHLVRPVAKRGFAQAGFPSYYDDDTLRHTLRCAGGLDFDVVAAAHRALRVPTLVAWAEDDPLIEPAIPLELIDVVPEGPRLRFESGGHNVQKDHAEEIGRAIASL